MIENKNGLKGLYNLAQGKRSDALGWSVNEVIVRERTFKREKILFRTKWSIANSQTDNLLNFVRESILNFFNDFPRTIFSLHSLPKALPWAMISWPFRPERHLPLIFLLFFSIGTMTQTSSLVYIGNDGKLIYKADSKGNVVPDFSGVGYMNGEVAIPYVPVVLEVKPVDGDNKANVQNAIDQVATLPLQPNGFRGAILFRAGTYNMVTSVTVSASGIVLRGEGDQTVFRANGTSQYDLIKIMGASGKSNLTATQKQITDTYVPLGANPTTPGLVCWAWICCTSILQEKPPTGRLRAIKSVSSGR